MATSNFTDVATTIRTRFNAQFAAARSTYARYVENDVPVNVDPSDKFVRINIRPADSRMIAFGSPRTFRDWGVVVVQIFVPVAEGDGELREVADDVRDIFLATTVSGVTFGVPRAAMIGPSEGHYQMNVTCPYWAHFQAA